EVTLSFRGTQEEVAAQQLSVEHTGHPCEVRVTFVVGSVLALLQQFQVHRVVEITDNDLVLMLFTQCGGHLQDVTLQDDDIGPPDRGVELAGGCDLEGGTGWCGAAVHRHQAHVVLRGQGGGDVPGTNGRSGHSLCDGITGDHQYSPVAAEVRFDLERSDEDLVGGRVTR